MRLRDSLVVVLTLGLIVAVASGMTVSAPVRRPPATPEPALPTPVPEVHAVEGLVGSVGTLDPLYATGPEAEIAALLFRRLTRLGPAGTLLPDLARSWEAAEDGRAWTFRLRADAQWEDGAPVTADDVVLTLRTLQHPDYDGPLAAAWAAVQATRLDRRTVRLRTSVPLGGFLAATTQLPIAPAHLLGGVPIRDRRAGAFGRRPLGNGPFRLESWVGERLTLVRSGPPPGGVPAPLPSNPLATPPEPTPGRPSGDVPLLDRYEFQVFPDAAALATAVETGTVDAAGGLPAAVRAPLADEPGVRELRYPTATLSAVFLNLRFERTTFQDPRVRRALALSIDRVTIVTSELGGAGVAASGLVPPTSFAHDPAATGSLPFDPTTGRALLRDAGWTESAGTWSAPGEPGPVRIELLVAAAQASGTAASASTSMAELVAEGWRLLGLDVVVTPVAVEVLVRDRIRPGQFDAVLLDVNLGLDPDLFPLLGSSQARFGGSNIAGYQSAAMDVLLREARGAGDDAARRGRFSLLQAALAQELPILPVAFADYSYLVGERLAGPAPRPIASPGDRFWDVLAWRFATGSNE